MTIKKLILAFLSVFLTLFALTSQAYTYSVSFLNSTGSTLTETVIANNNATHIECSGNCTSLPPNGNVIYKISSNDSTITEGTFTATFTYTKDSDYCLSATDGIIIKYDQITNYSWVTSFFVNIGEALPNGLYGSINITKKCAV